MSKKENRFRTKRNTESRNSADSMEVIIRRFAKEWRSGDFSHQQVSAAMFGRAWVDKNPSLRREGTLTARVTP